MAILSLNLVIPGDFKESAETVLTLVEKYNTKSPLTLTMKSQQRATRLSKAHPWLSKNQIESFLIKLMWLYEHNLGYTGKEYDYYVDLVVNQGCEASRKSVENTFADMGIVA